MENEASATRPLQRGPLLSGCNVYAVCGGVFGLSSIATMAAISLTRLVAVIDPFKSLQLTGRFTLSSCFAVRRTNDASISLFCLECILCSWIYGSIWILPPLFGWSRFVLEGFGTSCTFDYSSKGRRDRLFIFVLIIGGFLVPVSIIIVSYSFILARLFERGRRLTNLTIGDDHPTLQSKQLYVYHFHRSHSLSDDPPRSETTTIFEGDEDKCIARNFRRTEIRATRTALMVCTLFCTAWGPYSLMAVLAQLGVDQFVNPYSTAILAMFTKIAACINPLIYALLSSTFRRQICFYITFLCPCKNEQRILLPLGYNPARRRSRRVFKPSSQLRNGGCQTQVTSPL